MKNPMAVAMAVSAVALVLSIVALLSALREDTHDDGHDPRCKEAVARLSGRLASLEGGLAELASQQRAKVTDRAVGKTAAASIDPEELNRIIDLRTRQAIVQATGKARLGPDQLPEAVALAASNILEGARVVRAEESFKRGRTEFRLKMSIGRQQYDLRILPDGVIIEAEMPPGRAPQIVKDAVAAAVDGINMNKVKLEFDKEEGQQVYDVEGKVAGEKYDIIVATDGQVIEVDGPNGKVRFPQKPEDVAKPDGGAEIF